MSLDAVKTALETPKNSPHLPQGNCRGQTAAVFASLVIEVAVDGQVFGQLSLETEA